MFQIRIELLVAFLAINIGVFAHVKHKNAIKFESLPVEHELANKILLDEASQYCGNEDNRPVLSEIERIIAEKNDLQVFVYKFKGKNAFNYIQTIIYKELLHTFLKENFRQARILAYTVIKS